MCRGIEGHPHGIFWRLHVLYIPTICLYQQYVLTVLFFNGLCTSNMFMELQVVALWLYMSYTFCIVICLITKIYLSTKIFYRGMGWVWVNQHSMHLHSVTLSKMLRLGWWLLYIENTSWIAYVSLQWQL